MSTDLQPHAPPSLSVVTEQNCAEVLAEAVRQMDAHERWTAADLIPLLFSYSRQPLSYRNHFPFEPLFNVYRAPNLVIKAGRQVGKSLSVAAYMALWGGIRTAYNFLYVTVQQTMLRRFSHDYLSQLLEQSPVRSFFIGKNCPQSVESKTLRSGSVLHLSFAKTDALRIRGISASEVFRDEYQSADPVIDPIINEVTSGSPFTPRFTYTGTPLATNIAFEAKCWRQSSQAEWVTRCQACGHWNIPDTAHDFDRMIGPRLLVRNVTPEQPGVVCAKCGRPIFTRTGHWIHAFPDRRDSFCGYHVPQIIMPGHNEKEDMWRKLLFKRETLPEGTFYNEIGGIAWDSGSSLVTPAIMRQAANLPSNNDPSWKFQRIQQGLYRMVVMGVDWGGGGMGQDSFTVAVIGGLRRDGRIDIFHGWKSLTPNDQIGEAVSIGHLFDRFGCQFLAHDFNGAGKLREVVMLQINETYRRTGVSQDTIVPIEYTGFSKKGVLTHVPATENGIRGHIQLVKSESLSFLSNAISAGFVNFFCYDGDNRNEEMLDEFLNLTEYRASNHGEIERYLIVRDESKGPDDFAHAVNYCCHTLWGFNQAFPNLAEAARERVSQADLERLIRDPDLQSRIDAE